MFSVSIIVCLAGFVLGLLFRLAALLRMGLPLLYTLVVAFFLPGWSTRNPELSMGILYGLIGLTVLSWIISGIRKIGEIRAEREIERWQEEEALEQLIARQGYYKG